MNLADYYKIFAVNKYPLGFVFFNFLLLLIPFLLFNLLRRLEAKTGLRTAFQKAIAWLLGLLWLLFIPNAPYIVLEVRHYFSACFDNYYLICPVKSWQILFFFVYSAVGWIAFVYLLNLMKTFITKVKSAATANLATAAIIPVISLGVLLGLNSRLNSWDIFIRPKTIISDALVYFTDMDYFINLLAFSAFFYLLYWIGDRIFRKNNI